MITILTGGQSPGLCHVLLTEYWRSPADMCPNKATHYVTFTDPVAGIMTGRLRYPATTYTHVCAEHLPQVPNIIHSRPVTT